MSARSYARGFCPTQADNELLAAIEEVLKTRPAALEKCLNVQRWRRHMDSFGQQERKAFPVQNLNLVTL